MNIPKKSEKRTKSEPLRKEYAPRYVVAESVIENFVKHLRVRDAETAMARLQTVADITAGMRVKSDKLERSDSDLVKWLAAQSKNKDYRQIMRGIIEAIEQGEEGVEAAHRTARRAVEVGFRWSIYYFGALEMYKNRLRRIGRSAESGG
jgi:hypothetical protein